MAKRWIQIAPMGEFPHPAGVVQVIDAAAVKAMASSFDPGRKALIDFDHYSDLSNAQKEAIDEAGVSLPSEAAGWIENVEAREDGLYGLANFNRAGERAVTDEKYRFVSPVWLRRDCEAAGEGRIRPVCLHKVGLTNEPNIRVIAPIANREGAEPMAGPLVALANGDEPGHPFRGNQHTDGQGGGGEVRGELGKLFDEATTGKDNRQRMVPVREVNAKEVEETKKQTGVDVSGYRHAVDNYSVRHIIDTHGDAAREAARGQLPITRDDIVKIPDIVDSPDGREYAGKTPQGRDTIRYRKTIGDTTYLVEEVRTGKKMLVPVSMWKRKGRTTSDAPDSRSPLSNAQGASSDADSIANRLEGVNVDFDPADPIANFDPKQPRSVENPASPIQPNSEPNTKGNTIMREKLIEALGLDAEATDEQILEAVTAMKNSEAEDEKKAKELENAEAEAAKKDDEIEDLKNRLANANKAAIEAKVDAALVEHADKIENREDTRAALLANFDATVKLLKAIKAPAATLPNRADGKLPEGKEKKPALTGIARAAAAFAAGK